MRSDIARWRLARQAQHHHSNGNGGPSASEREINVGDMERQFSMIGGTALAVYGLARGSFTGLALAGIGAALIWRGHTGHCQMYEMLGHNSAGQPEDHGNYRASAEQHEPLLHSGYDEGYAAGDAV